MGINQETLLLIKGDQKILKKLFDRYSREMYYFAMGLIDNRQIAEDAIQESFLYIWNHRQQLDPTREIGGYLRESIKNFILNNIRHLNVRHRHQDNIIREQLFLNEEWPDITEQIQLIREVIDTLPENCRKIFLMTVVEGHAYAEAARQMDISVNTVKSQVRIAYRKIRSALEDKEIKDSLLLLLPLVSKLLN